MSCEKYFHNHRHGHELPYSPAKKGRHKHFWMRCGNDYHRHSHWKCQEHIHLGITPEKSMYIIIIEHTAKLSLVFGAVIAINEVVDRILF